MTGTSRRPGWLLLPLLPLATSALQAGGAPEGIAVIAPGNPILADGRFYSADPAPFVAGDKLWILAGRDEAPDGVNDFIMKEWQLLETGNPAGHLWQHYPAAIRPETVFAWAEESRAYASQIVPAPDGRFYLYAPVMEQVSSANDRFAIGVAVADNPLGPWRDAHPAGPIISQLVPEPNDIQNIDPTILIDDDERIYIFWGTFGELRGMELAADMVTPKGPVRKLEGLTGFFEAPWIMKRKGIYYMLYAGNNAAPDSPCTPAIYHACIAYGTAPSPLGPWTYRGIVLKPVSSTTSHPGAVEFRDNWYLAYHTADAKDGGHFRRSVAIDRIRWDDSVAPPAIKTVIPTRRPQPPRPPSRNIAPAATATASNMPVPVRHWIKALNDGVIRENPLPPDMWGSWTPDNPAQQWIEYRWPEPVVLNGSRIWFWGNMPTEWKVKIAPPQSWHLEYWDEGWMPVPTVETYGNGPGRFEDISFGPITTRCIRAVFSAAKVNGAFTGLGVAEWEVLAPATSQTPIRDDATLPPDACG